MTPAMTSERWQHIKHVVNSALQANSQSRTALLQQSCADDFALRIGAEALLSITRKLPEQPLAPDQWQRIEQLFQAALELTPSKRPAFLAQACDDNEQLRLEVESLLVYQGAAGALIGGVVHEAAGLLPTDEKARFTPGTTLNKRYRILGLLGKGGMGEVYRADDLTLQQPVALKFLSERMSRDKAMLTRFRSEVSMAHRVTHPNVCRVHDIGEVITSSGALQFLSMEYVDGEDLSSLLRRIGRLPSDKAVEIANQLCAGLAAAHEAGVLHRDLKPANVMIDGRGRVRITDFGLAGFAEQITGSEVMAGTPAYMSPEQFVGKEVTTKSDIYALGLVLYEVFTGKRVFEAGSLDELKRMHESSAPTNPSSWVKDLDPLVERVILRCLEKDPARRLTSAKQVADALPGGDPLAAALAMGETPSPEMVAAAGQKTGMKPLYAVLCLVGIIAGLLAFTYLNSKQSLVLNSSLHNPPEVMASKARAVITQLGYSDQAADSAYGYDADQVCSDYYDKLSSSPERWQPVREGKTTAVHFWYRQSPRELVPNKERIFTGNNLPLVVTASDPPENVSGMIGVKLNPRGQLIRFGVVPPQVVEATAKTSEPDWKQAFDLAGLELARFTPTTAQWMPNPPGACDLQMAWTGVSADQPELPLRVEAAAYRGKLVSFQVIAPYTQPSRNTPWTTAEKSGQAFKTVVFFAILLGALFLTRHNLRQGRGDRKGGLRLTAFVFVTMMLGAVLGSAWDQIDLIRTFVAHTGSALYQSIWIGLLYLALEPFLRRRWPHALITWSRVLQGNLRDAVVGRDALIGILWASLSNAVFLFPMVAEGKLTNDAWFIHNLLGVRYGFAWMLGQVGWAIFFAFALFLLFFLLMLLTRRQWIAGSIVVLLSLVWIILEGSPLNIAAGLFCYSGLVLVLLRYGLWATAVSIFAGGIMSVSCLTLQFSAWHAGGAILGFVVLLALAGYAFYTALGGQKVFSGKLLEE